MAGETIKCEALCLRIAPWSRTSHIVTWLTPHGIVVTSVKGAVRPKSAFLGQYDLNYTCELVYYASSRGDLHALRECFPVETRDALRADYRLFALSDYFRAAVSTLAPQGEEAADWFRLLTEFLDGLDHPDGSVSSAPALVAALVDFELKSLKLAGMSPELQGERDSFMLRGERSIPVTEQVFRCLRNVRAEKNIQILLDTARTIGVFYTFHIDGFAEMRRSVVRMICN